MPVAFAQSVIPLRTDAVPRKRTRVASRLPCGFFARSWTGNASLQCGTFIPNANPRPIQQRPDNVPTEPLNGKFMAVASLLSPLSSLAGTGVGIFVLGFIIFVHETGHFLAARLQNIKVDNFSIGFGPALFEFKPQNSDTLFTIRALPLGGYVAFPEKVTIDEETKEEIINDDPDLLQNRPLLDRAIVVSAGVVANIILAWASTFASVCTVGVLHYSFNPGVYIADLVDPNGPGAKGGLHAGDIILKVDGETVKSSTDNAATLADKIRTSRGNPMKFHLLREGREFDLTVLPKCCTPDGGSVMGVQLVPNMSVSRVHPTSPLSTITMTNAEVLHLTKQTINALRHTFSNFSQSAKNLSGPIGVVSMGADLARTDAASLFTFCALISINLALINSLPLPALDGGQMVFLIIEGLKGSPVSLQLQNTVNRTALLLFLAFSGVLFFGDITKLLG